MFKHCVGCGVIAMFSVFGATPAVGAPPDLARQLGVSHEIFIVNLPILYLHSGGSDSPPSGICLLPGHAEKPELLPGGWLIWVEKDSVLYKAGLRTGDVVTNVGSSEIFRMDQELPDLLKKNAVKGKVQLQVRHFRAGFWRKKPVVNRRGIIPKDEESKRPPWYKDRTVRVTLPK